MHGKLAAFYEVRRSALGLVAGKEAEDKIWREYSLEWIYHTICAAPQASVGLALNGFLMALKRSTGFAQSWAKAIVQAGKETDCAAMWKWGEVFRDGMIAAQEKRYADVIPCLTAILGAELVEVKISAVAWNWRSYCYRQLGQHELAFPDARKAVEINPEEEVYQFDLALIYQKLKDYENAIECYGKAIEIDSQHKRAFANRGEVYRLTERYDEALKDFDRAIEVDDKYAWAIASRGQTYQALKQYEEALKDFDRAIELEPTACKYGQRGQTYQALKRSEEALKSFDRAIEVDEKYVWGIASRGKVYQSLRRYEEALKDFDRVIDLEQNNVSAYSERGFVYYQLNRYIDSIKSFEKAKSFNSENLYYSICLSYLHLLLDDVKSSEDILQIIMNNEADSRAILNYGLLMSRKGEIEKARIAWEMGLRKLEIDSDWDKAVSYVFTISLGEIEQGLAGMRLLIEECSDATVFRNALNEATILSRSPQPIPGIQDLILLLESKLSQ